MKTALLNPPPFVRFSAEWEVQICCESCEWRSELHDDSDAVLTFALAKLHAIATHGICDATIVQTEMRERGRYLAFDVGEESQWMFWLRATEGKERWQDDVPQCPPIPLPSPLAPVVPLTDYVPYKPARTICPTCGAAPGEWCSEDDNPRGELRPRHDHPGRPQVSST